MKWQFRKKLQKHWTPFYHPLLPHLFPELKSKECSMQSVSEFLSSPVTSSFVNELSLSEQKIRRKCLCTKHITGGISASSHLFPLCQWKTWLKPVWHVPASICPICHSHNHCITRPQLERRHVLSFLNAFWAAVNLNYCTSSVSMF